MGRLVRARTQSGEASGPRPYDVCPLIFIAPAIFARSPAELSQHSPQVPAKASPLYVPVTWVEPLFTHWTMAFELVPVTLSATLIVHVYEVSWHAFPLGDRFVTFFQLTE